MSFFMEYMRRSLGEQALDVETIRRTEGRSHAQANQVAAGNFSARSTAS